VPPIQRQPFRDRVTHCKREQASEIDREDRVLVAMDERSSSETRGKHIRCRGIRSSLTLLDVIKVVSVSSNQCPKKVINPLVLLYVL
jgi:hypothetical protein